MEVAADSPMECLSRLEADFPRLRDWMYDKNGQFSPLVQLFVNGERVYPDEWDRDLQDGDELFLMLAIGGG
jgi:molybdopterin converting factor small subunit